MKETDTIAAIATPLGSGGIGIVRISGAHALDVARQIFKPKHNKTWPMPISHKAIYGHVADGEQLVDEVMLLYMQAPRTYTREDVVEISCHGSILSVQKILSVILNKGCRLAAPGEFTKRAFLNGRIDLAQAEAVIDLINAKSDRAHQNSLRQLEGGLSTSVAKIRNELLAAIAAIEAAIDYPDADLVTLDNTALAAAAKTSLAAVDKLLKTAASGRIIKNGIKTAIIGLPNAGKSSLLNAMLQSDRAIVTDMPGTTRDVLEESVHLDGISLVMMDTAGIRQAKDEVEKIGISRSMRAIEACELVLVVLDGATPPTPEEDALFTLVEGKQQIMVCNKADCLLAEKLAHVTARATAQAPPAVLSAKTGQGMDELTERIKALFFTDKLHHGTDLITSLRHEEALRLAKEALCKAIDTIERGLPEDFISIDLQAAYTALGTITGESVTEDLIDKIFSEFCLGK